ncbi:MULTISPECIES: ABC transporter ATP-binding protein [Pseudonocardia]|uniref:ABC transporter n=2 Tax=Pseudonocardia TaxID=1847 RepID=A0ABQ0RR72_9PSEU|nr:putative multidrug export ATP-binding/permease protein [Pseudonocardia autotrophica]TDN71337.1 ABC-type multidrug transport system fused ATPase/permease subunit [Pseudonocardia autotrophica]BBG02011.1 ABC transporter [Pseudonocardia autotrophica]GEC23175.1 ABC transporter [Pseudonocardia saturnea]
MDRPLTLMRGVIRGADSQSIRRGSIAKGTWPRIWGFVRPYRRWLIGYLALTTVTAVIGVLTPLLAGRVVNTIVAANELPDAARVIIVIAGAIAGMAVLEAVVGLAGRWFSSRLGESLIADLRVAVFRHVQAMPLAFFARTRTGALVSRLNNDVIGAQTAITSTLSTVLANTIQLVLAIAVMLGLAWQVTLLAMLLLPVFVLPARRMGVWLAELRREAAELNATMGNQMTERFSAPGATLVKLFGDPAQEAGVFRGQVARVREIGVRSAMVSRLFVTALQLVSALAQALIYGLGGYLAVTGQIPAGTIVALGLLLTRLYTPMTALANARVDVMTALVAFERVFEVLDLVPSITEPQRPRAVPDGPVDVTLRNVRFTYPNAADVSLASLEEVAVLDQRVNAEVLHGIDLHVHGGGLLALVGTSGAGKSTLASLVPRLHDVGSGAVELSGVDVRDLDFATLRRTVGMVTQDGHLFHDTIGGNLRYAAPDASEAEMTDALHRARLGDLMAALPDGLDTVVGERGYRLSGGERQRLTIARLLLARPRVVILDEATAHLDSESEVAVQEALAEALVGRTAIVIAHRLSTVRAADRIAVLEAGRVVETGTHVELLAAGGRYATLHRTQFAPETAPTVR